MDLVNGSISLFCAGLALIMLVIELFRTRREQLREKSTWLSILTLSFLMVLSDGLALVAFRGNTAVYAVLIALSFLCYYCILDTYPVYLSHALKVSIRRIHPLLLGCAILCGLGAIAWVTNCFYPLYYDIYTNTVTNKLLYLSSVLPGLYSFVLSMGIVLRKRKRLHSGELAYLILVPSLPLIATLVGWIVPGLKLQYPLMFVALFINNMRFYRTKTRQLAERELELQAYRLQATVDRVKPHFIQNVLSTIYYLVDSDAAKAKEAIRFLSDYMHEVQRILERAEPVLFSQELELIRDYLALEAMRFGDRLQVRYDIQADSFRIPPFSVQPLVENAVKHGLGNRERVQILIRSEAGESGWTVTVQDDGEGFFPPDALEQSEPSGLRNIRDILTVVDGRMEIDATPGHGTTVRLQLPKSGTRNR